MATYTGRHFPYSHPKRKKQKYSLMTAVVDLSKAPVTSGTAGKDGAGTKAWAAGDVLQLFYIRAGQTVLGVQFELLESGTAKAGVDIGYGSDTDRWGRFAIDNTTIGVVNSISHDAQINEPFIEPLYFASADTLDVKIWGTPTTGKFRLIVHLLEDDR